MKKFERKTVTISVTPEEYDAISHAISEYLRGRTINRDFENNINSFLKKYQHATRMQAFKEFKSLTEDYVNSIQIKVKL